MNRLKRQHYYTSNHEEEMSNSTITVNEDIEENVDIEGDDDQQLEDEYYYVEGGEYEEDEYIEVNKQMYTEYYEPVHINSTAQCPECSRIFYTSEQLMLHVENCMLEAFEREVSAIYDMHLRQVEASRTVNRYENSLVSNNKILSSSSQNFKDKEVGNHSNMVTYRPNYSTNEDDFDNEKFFQGIKARPIDLYENSNETVIHHEEEQIAYDEIDTDIHQEKICIEHVNVDELHIEGSDICNEPVSQEIKDNNIDKNIQNTTSVNNHEEVVDPLIKQSIPVNLTEQNMDGTYKLLRKPKMECPTCGLWLYRHNFSAHFRTHTGDQPHACPYCDKKFKTTSAQKVHVRAHTGEKPYHCMCCDYSALTKRNLDRHILNNHVNSPKKNVRVRKSVYRKSRDAYTNDKALPEEDS
uniref:C2H2-type domain-containing protein n=1 Tax=Parastrongyloides trichosuri TaxID=131310 RepID=A0A0N4ZU98_PARTI